MVNGQPPAVRGGSSRPEPKPDRPTPRVPGVHSRRVLHPDLRLDPTPNLDVVGPVAGCRQPPEHSGPRFGHLGVSDGPPSPIDIRAVCSGRNDQADGNHHSQHQTQERSGDALEPSTSCLLCHAFPFLPLPSRAPVASRGGNRPWEVRVRRATTAMGTKWRACSTRSPARPPLPPASPVWASPANEASDLDRGGSIAQRDYPSEAIGTGWVIRTNSAETGPKAIRRRRSLEGPSGRSGYRPGCLPTGSRRRPTSR
jgi:hypothetical protein